jgi:hypothetical protein
LLGLVLAAGIEGEFSQDFAGGCVDDGDVEVVDQCGDFEAVVVASEADVEELAGVAQGDLAFADAVVADAGVGLVRGFASVAGFGFRSAGVGRAGSAPAEGSVGSVVVVLLDEGIDQGLELLEGVRLVPLVAEPLLEGLLEAFDLALGLRMAAAAVLLDNPQAGEFGFERGASAVDFLEANRTVYTIPLSVNVLAGMPCSA